MVQCQCHWRLHAAVGCADAAAHPARKPVTAKQGGSRYGSDNRGDARTAGGAERAGRQCDCRVLSKEDEIRKLYTDRTDEWSKGYYNALLHDRQAKNNYAMNLGNQMRVNAKYSDAKNGRSGKVQGFERFQGKAVCGTGKAE